MRRKINCPVNPDLLQTPFKSPNETLSLLKHLEKNSATVVSLYQILSLSQLLLDYLLFLTLVIPQTGFLALALQLSFFVISITAFILIGLPNFYTKNKS